MSKDALPTVDIKGKSYVLVKDRIIFFNETYKNGAIQTERQSADKPGQIVMKAMVFPDVENPNRYFTAYSQEVEGSSAINKTSALENAETSAVGRALAMMGIGVIESIASADEVHKAIAHTEPEDRVTLDDVAPVRDCPKHPGKQAKFKSTPWGGKQWSHPEATEEKGWCNITVS